MYIKGETVVERKKCLANLICEELRKKGNTAETLFNEKGESGHKDTVVISSNIGKIHVTATESKEPDSSFRGVQAGDTWMEGKDFVAFGWNTKDDRTMIMFTRPEDLPSGKSLSKDDIRKVNVKEYTMVLK